MHGLPKQSCYNALDTFEYPASLTLFGKREATSCCGGFCCLILSLFVVLIGIFQVSVYLNKTDTRIGMTTSLMQPVSIESNSTFNSQIRLITG